MITLTYRLNIYQQGVPQVVHLSQYDSDFTLIFGLYSSFGTFTLEEGTTAELRCTKPDGNGYSKSGTVSGTTVTIEGDNQLTACSGCFPAEITLYKNEKELNTVNFTFSIERAALDAGTIESETVLEELQAIIDGAATATQAASDAQDAQAAAEAAAASLVIDPTLTHSGQAADAKATGDAVDDLKNDLGALTDTEIVANFTKTMTGTAATQWQINVPVTVTDDMYICLYAVKNVTTANRKMWFRTIYTDSTMTDTEVVSVGQWYKINFDSSKTFQSVNIMFTRSDEALSSNTESEFDYLIVKRAPIEYFKNSVNLYHYFAVGTIVGLINIDTINNKITIPLGYFYQTGDIYGREIPATEIDASALPVMSVICVDWANRTYVAFGYNDYRTKKVDKYTAILTYRKDTRYFASPYQVAFDGSTYVTSDTALTVANSAADAKVTGLLHNYAVGHIWGKINFDTVNQKVTIPGGYFYHTGQEYGREIPTTELNYSTGFVMNVICIDWDNLSYVILPYLTYRQQPSTQYEAIATYRTATPEDYSSPYQITINGFSVVKLNESGVPYYWVDELESKIDNVASLQTYSEGVTFGFITDIHWETNFQKSPELLEYVAKHSRLDMWINGGDSATGDQGNGTLQIKRLYECIGSYNRNYKFYSIIGNHDDNSIPAGHTTLSSDTLRNLVMPDYDGITFGDGNYYYFDYRGTRFICLDTKNVGASDPTQVAWASNVIQNSTLPVIIAMHIVKVSISDAEPCAFFNDLITAIGNNNETKVKMIIGGHSHNDYHFTASNGIPVVVLDTDSKSSDDGIARVNGTISEQCFSAVTVDYVNKTINVTRFGSIGNSFTVTY